MTKVRGSRDGVSDTQSSTVPKTIPVLESGVAKRLIHLNISVLRRCLRDQCNMRERGVEEVRGINFAYHRNLILDGVTVFG